MPNKSNLLSKDYTQSSIYKEYASKGDLNIKQEAKLLEAAIRIKPNPIVNTNVPGCQHGSNIFPSSAGRSSPF